jgi:hypothetical protein
MVTFDECSNSLLRKAVCNEPLDHLFKNDLAFQTNPLGTGKGSVIGSCSRSKT